MATTAPDADSVAIIGMAGRFPGAPDIQTLWRNLKHTVDCVGEIPSRRWPADAFFHIQPATALKSYCRRGGFLDDIESFDNDYFGISEDEAGLMDPKQRLLLESAEEALFDAGCKKDDIKNTTTGVFIGSAFDYHARRLRMHKRTSARGILGNHNPVLANRLSHHYDLMGPSLYLNTFCSSSLIAVHLACRSILGNECPMAIVGGAHVLDLEHYISLSQIRALSLKGRCSTFDQAADGFVPGEGVGVVILKQACQAMADNDNIYAVIKGSAINHTGRANNLASPRREAQEQLLEAAYTSAGVDCDSVSAIETHGTGTILGDMIEFRALNNFFSRRSSRKRFCSLGSIKANIGHLEPASGIAGLIKTALCLKHRMLPGLVHFNQLSRFIRMEDSPFYIHSQTQNWPANGCPRRAGINAFGLSGSSVHVILEEVVPDQENQHSRARGPRPVFNRRRFPALIENTISHHEYFGLTRTGPPPSPAGGPAVAGDTSFLRKTVLEIFSRKLCIDSKDLDETAPLDDLGLDSILRVDVIQALVETWPAAAAVQDQLIAADSVKAFILILNRRVHHSSENHRIDGAPSTAADNEIAIHLSGLKDHPENRVCAVFQDNSNRSGPLSLRLLVSETHMFFFDHPLDHVSGLHLIEAMLQAVAVDYQRSGGAKSAHNLFFSEINVEFINICPKIEDVRIEATVLPFRDFDDATKLYSLSVLSDRQVYCTGSIRVGQVDGRATDDSASEAGFEKACRPDSVNKNNPDNVLVSEADSDSGAYRFHVRPLTTHPYFSDPKGAFTPTIYLLEAFRQTQRYIDIHFSDAKNREKNSLLTQLGIRMSVPVSRKTAVMMHAWQEISQPKDSERKHVFINGRARIRAGQQDVGVCRARIIQYQH